MLSTSEWALALREQSVPPVTHQAPEVAGVMVEKTASRKKKKSFKDTYYREMEVRHEYNQIHSIHV